MKRWKKGVGEMIGYTIAILFLTIFYFIIMNALILNNAENVMEECVMNIGRQVVTCESLKDAQDRVQDVAKYYLQKETRVIDKSSIKATVTFAPGYKRKVYPGQCHCRCPWFYSMVPKTQNSTGNLYD